MEAREASNGSLNGTSAGSIQEHVPFHVTIDVHGMLSKPSEAQEIEHSVSLSKQRYTFSVVIIIMDG